MMADWNLYYIFYKTAQAGSVSKAAKTLFTSQPAVSQSIKLLEEKLGGKLFVRSHQGVSLTVEGRTLFQFVEQGYNFFETAERKFREMQNLQAGQVRIGVSDTLCKYFLIDCLEAFHRLYPQVRIHVTNQTSMEILDFLRSGKIDLGLVNLPVDREGDFSVEEILTVHDCFIAGRRFKQATSRIRSFQEVVTRYPLLLLERASNSRQSLEQYAAKRNLVLAPEIELGTIDLLVQFAQRGFGVACVAREFVRAELRRGEINEILLDEPIAPRKVGAISLTGTPVSAAAGQFIALMKAKGAAFGKGAE